MVNLDNDTLKALKETFGDDFDLDNVQVIDGGDLPHAVVEALVKALPEERKKKMSREAFTNMDEYKSFLQFVEKYLKKQNGGEQAFLDYERLFTMTFMSGVALGMGKGARELSAFRSAAKKRENELFDEATSIMGYSIHKFMKDD